MSNKRITEKYREKFEDWWFKERGESYAMELFEEIFSTKEIEMLIKKQPSWKLIRNKENAFAEAVWDWALHNEIMEKSYICMAKLLITLIKKNKEMNKKK